MKTIYLSLYLRRQEAKRTRTGAGLRQDQQTTVRGVQITSDCLSAHRALSLSVCNLPVVGRKQGAGPFVVGLPGL